MQKYEIENSFSKLRRLPSKKVEVKKEGNITEVKKVKTEIVIPKGGCPGIGARFPRNGQFRKFIL